MNKWPIRTLATVFVAVLATLATRPAAACSYWERAWALPNERSRVPTNTRIWIYYEGSQSAELTLEDFTIVDDAGASVAARLDTVLLPSTWRGALHVLTPLEPLKKKGVYQVSGLVPTTFTVTDDPDHDAPGKPREAQRKASAQAAKSSCSAYAHVVIDYEPAEPRQEFVVGVFDDYDTFDADTLKGTLSVVGSDVEYTAPGDLQLTLGPGAVSSWPQSAPKTVRLRVGMFDLAGNFSGWSEPSVVDPPAVPGGACSVSRVGQSAASGPLLALLALCALAARRAQRCRMTAWPTAKRPARVTVA